MDGWTVVYHSVFMPLYINCPKCSHTCNNDQGCCNNNNCNFTWTVWKKEGVDKVTENQPKKPEQPK
jgi:hypothetical protein